MITHISGDGLIISATESVLYICCANDAIDRLTITEFRFFEYSEYLPSRSQYNRRPRSPCEFLQQWCYYYKQYCRAVSVTTDRLMIKNHSNENRDVPMDKQSVIGNGPQRHDDTLVRQSMTLFFQSQNVVHCFAILFLNNNPHRKDIVHAQEKNKKSSNLWRATSTIYYCTLTTTSY